METTTQTTKRVVIERDIPGPAIEGLVEFVNRYYFPPKMRFIEALSCRKTESGDGFELFWRLKPVGSEQARPLPVALRITIAAIEFYFPSLDPDNKSQEKVISRTVDEIEALVLSYFLNVKTTSIYFVIGATEEHSEAPNQRSPMSNAVKRIFAGNTTSLFLSFTLLSFALYFIIGVYTVFLLISVQLVALIFSDRIVYRLGSVRPNAERPLVTIASVYLGIFYFVLAFGGIYLIGKLLETRADTESAVMLGNPGALASALTKIGFRQLYREKYNPGTKLFDWFRFDPHPPIYFRIARLSRYSEKQKAVRHTLLISVHDIIVGFFSALF